MADASVTEESARIVPPLVVSELTKRHGKSPALDGVSFRIEAGQAVGLVGRNGAGKSTLFKILAGISHFDSGDVRIFDLPVAERKTRSQVGYLPEDVALYPEMTGSEYLVFRGELRGLTRNHAREDAEKKAEQAGATVAWRRELHRLSKGEQKRLAIAATLLGDPPLLLLDEPTAGLDPAQVDEVRRLVSEVAKKRTVVISTHLIADVEATCTRLLVLHKGRLKFDGALDSLPEAPSAEGGVVQLLKEEP
jgi:ABC-2 type transport system ATP-binding protein